jgi:polysaccharide pyruvyl transferase WcaK-like protein
MSDRQQPHIALIGEFGVGNMGNDASCQTVLELLRALDADVTLSVISRSPSAAEQLLGVAAAPISASSAESRFWGHLGPATRIVEKIRDLFHLVRIIGRYDVVIVPGTGVLEAADRRNPGGVIVWLLLIALACRIRRVSLVWFAVGGSRYRFRLPARAAVLAARGANYRSFRDDVTASALRANGLEVPKSAISRDVVFARAMSLASAAEMQTHDRISTVAIAAIDYQSGGQETPYLERLTEVALSVLDLGMGVVVVSGDDSDEIFADELMRRISEAGHPRASTVNRVRRGDFDQLIGVLSGTDLVIASRFHVLLAGVLLRLPVIAISHATKDDELLRQLDIARYAHPIATFSVADIQQSIAHVNENIEAIRHDLERGCAEAHTIVLSDFRRMGRAIQLAERKSA